MKIFIAFVLSLFISFSCMHAQESAKPNIQDTKPSVSDTVKNAEAEPIYPDEDDFVPTDKDPFVDIEELQSYIVYPDWARREGLEGKIVLRILINEKAEIVKYKVQYSDHEIFNKPAIDAILKCKKFTPAYLNNKPVSVWVSVPINFRLVDTEE